MLRLVNGSTGDPCLYLDFPGAHNAVLFDCGELWPLTPAEIRDVAVLCLTHHHLDHFASFDRLLRGNIDTAKTLDVYGPRGTIEFVTRKLQSHRYPAFPFMRLTVRIHEARFDKHGEPDNSDGPAWQVVQSRCQNGFAIEPVRTRNKPPKTWHSQRECRITAVPVDHTVPCVAYVLDVPSGHRFDRGKAGTGVLKPGPWIGRVLDALDAPASARPERIDVGGHRAPLKTLVHNYFTREGRRRYAFVTDTVHTKPVVARLRGVASGADVLFCDGYYPHREQKSAKRHKHHTARQAGELASALGVKELWLMHLPPRFADEHDKMIEEARAVFTPVRADLNPDPRR